MRGEGGLAGNPPGWVGAGRGAGIGCGLGRRGSAADEGAGGDGEERGEALLREIRASENRS